MLERWYPTAHVPSVFAIDYEKLAALGYKGILFDIDNTLVHHGDDSTPEVDALFRHIHSLFIAEAGKPDPAAYRRACAMLGLPPEQVVCVGDQVFRDIRGANSAGLDSILVDFIRLPGETHYGKKRVLEKVILWFYHRDPRRRGRLDGIGK